jgi:hypothetical protein
MLQNIAKLKYMKEEDNAKHIFDKTCYILNFINDWIILFHPKKL